MCQDEEILGVTREQAEYICKVCPFFDSCLNREMAESVSRIIHKPDWSLAIARHLIQLLVTSRTTLPSLHLYEEFSILLDFLVLDARLCNFVNYMDTTRVKHETVVELANIAPSIFTVTGKVTSRLWSQLLAAGLFLSRKDDDSDYTIQLHDPSRRKREREQLSYRRETFDRDESEWEVHTKLSIHGALGMIQQVLESNMRPGESPSSRELPLHGGKFALRLVTEHDLLGKDHRHMINRLAGEDVITVGFAVMPPPKVIIHCVKASAGILRRKLAPLCDMEDIPCTLSVEDPSPDTVGRLINACLSDSIASNVKGTVGLGVNGLFFYKPIPDTVQILRHLVDFSTTAQIDKTFTFRLSPDKGKTF